MYVCLCKGVTDHQIRAAADNGAKSFREARRELDLASQCGKCARMARDIFDDQMQKNLDPDLFYPAAAPAV